MSEFGTGYAYCLGLFLAHAERVRDSKRIQASMEKEGHTYNDAPEMWFYGAADHIIELSIPTALPDNKRQEIEAFKEKCLQYRFSMGMSPKATWEDVEKALNTAKRLLLEWDLFLNIPAEKGDWE